MSPSSENTVNVARELAPSPQVIDSNVGQKRKVNPALIPLLLPRFDNTPL